MQVLRDHRLRALTVVSQLGEPLRGVGVGEGLLGAAGAVLSTQLPNPLSHHDRVVRAHRGPSPVRGPGCGLGLGLGAGGLLVHPLRHHQPVHTGVDAVGCAPEPVLSRAAGSDAGDQGVLVGDEGRPRGRVGVATAGGQLAQPRSECGNLPHRGRGRTVRFLWRGHATPPDDVDGRMWVGAGAATGQLMLESVGTTASRRPGRAVVAGGTGVRSPGPTRDRVAPPGGRGACRVPSVSAIRRRMRSSRRSTPTATDPRTVAIRTAPNGSCRGCRVSLTGAPSLCPSLMLDPGFGRT